MKRFIRCSSPDDVSAIGALFAELGLQPNIRPEDLQWKYWTRRADWPSPRSFVLVSDGAVVAHAAMVPGAVYVENRRVATGHVIDWVARRGEVGAGVALMKYIGKQVEALWAFGGSTDTLRILPHIGFRAAGTVSGYARPLFPLRILKTDVRRNWRLLPRLARNLGWQLAAPRVDTAAWRVRPITSDADIERLAGCLPKGGKGAVILERSPELLRYMLNCPIVRTALYVLEGPGGAGGYFMLAHVPGQVRIIDCWMRSQQLPDWRAMISGAVAEAAQDTEAAEVVLWAGSDLQRAVVESCGFRARLHLPVQVRASTGSPSISEALNVQMLDNDAAYLHEGGVTHWI